MMPTIPETFKHLVSPNLGHCGPAQPTYGNQTQIISLSAQPPKALPHGVPPGWVVIWLSHALLADGHNESDSTGRLGGFPCPSAVHPEAQGHLTTGGEGSL